jgi:hypothetical protein
MITRIHDVPNVAMTAEIGRKVDVDILARPPPPLPTGSFLPLGCGSRDSSRPQRRVPLHNIQPFCADFHSGPALLLWFC